MENIDKLWRAALLFTVAAQLWMIYRIENLSASASSSNAAATLSADSKSSSTELVDLSLQNTNADQNTIQKVLERIDARLANVEKSPTTSNKQSALHKNHYEPSTNERAAADQRLSSLLPSGPLTREDFVRLNADIQALPAEERFAVATALSRAINEGRVQTAPGAL